MMFKLEEYVIPSHIVQRLIYDHIKKTLPDGAEYTCDVKYFDGVGPSDICNIGELRVTLKTRV